MISISLTWLILVAFPFVLQAVALGIDEFVFHHRRGLPRWERIGHPLDTLSVLLVSGIAYFATFSNSNLQFFAVLSLMSCLFVTKDEWVHSRLCDAREQWLHGVLFVCHPLVFVSTAFLWCWRDRPDLLSLGGDQQNIAALAVQGQFFLLSFFLAYQVIYWNIFRQNQTVSDSNAKLMPREMRSESVDPQSCASEIG